MIVENEIFNCSKCKFLAYAECGLTLAYNLGNSPFINVIPIKENYIPNWCPLLFKDEVIGVIEKYAKKAEQANTFESRDDLDKKLGFKDGVVYELT